MSKRLALHELLKNVLGSDNVYFQPPSTVSMKYPAIVYGVDDIDNSHANNGVYLTQMKYRVTVIDTCPDSKTVERVMRLPSCNYVRSYKKDNLNHTVFTVHI